MKLGERRAAQTQIARGRGADRRKSLVSGTILPTDCCQLSHLQQSFERSGKDRSQNLSPFGQQSTKPSDRGGTCRTDRRKTVSAWIHPQGPVQLSCFQQSLRPFGVDPCRNPSRRGRHAGQNERAPGDPPVRPSFSRTTGRFAPLHAKAGATQLRLRRHKPPSRHRADTSHPTTAAPLQATPPRLRRHKPPNRRRADTSHPTTAAPIQ